MGRRWGRLPESGESSYCIVLGGLDSKQWHKKFRRKPARRNPRATRPFVACLRRYFLSRGSREAENTEWFYPPTNPIRPHSPIVYTIPGFASFTDAAEAFCYSAVLKAYCAGSEFKVVQINRG